MDLPLLGNRYRILSVLGRGASSTVYHCQDATRNLECTIKQFVAPAGADAAALMDQFRLEARLLSQLTHPGLPRVIDYFEDGASVYLVMDYLGGRTLLGILNEAPRPLPLQQSLMWLHALLNVLSYLHSQNPPILYRDVNPSSMMIQAGGSLHLMDFGLARVLVADRRTQPALRGLGSSGYAPPEQYGHATTSVRSDLYGVGATAYHLFTGQPPPDAMSLALNSEKLEPPRQVNRFLPRDLNSWVLKGLAIRPSDRFGSADEMRAALSDATTSYSEAPSEDASGSKKAAPSQHPPENLFHRFVTGLWGHLKVHEWQDLKPPRPFRAGFERQQGMRRVQAYVLTVETLDAEACDKAIDEAQDLLRALRQKETSAVGTIFIVLAALQVPDEAAALTAANSASTQLPQVRSTVFIPVHLTAGKCLDNHVSPQFSRPGDLADLVFNVRLAAQETVRA